MAVVAKFAATMPEHQSHRDHMQNMYRTSYQDMVHGREVAVKNDFPAGYGGHVPSMRHDVMFRNTEFDRMHAALRDHPDRYSFPNFADQKNGVPCYTAKPRGVRRVPPDVTAKPPWAVALSLQDQPSFRASPWSRTCSHDRVNTSALLAGNSMTLQPQAGRMKREDPIMPWGREDTPTDSHADDLGEENLHECTLNDKLEWQHDGGATYANYSRGPSSVISNSPPQAMQSGESRPVSKESNTSNDQHNLSAKTGGSSRSSSGMKMQEYGQGTLSCTPSHARSVGSWSSCHD